MLNKGLIRFLQNLSRGTPKWNKRKQGRGFRVATGGPGPGQWTEIRFAPHLSRVNMLPKNAGYSFSPATWGL